MVTHAEMILNAFETLGEAKPSQVISWIEEKYGKVNVESIRGDLMGFSINHTSAHHYPGSNKFLWFIKERKSYRIANSNEISSFKQKQEAERKPEPAIEDEVFASKLSPSGQVVIPARIREKMELKAGDILGFELTDQGILVRKAKKKLEYLR